MSPGRARPVRVLAGGRAEEPAVLWEPQDREEERGGGRREQRKAAKAAPGGSREDKQRRLAVGTECGRVSGRLDQSFLASPPHPLPLPAHMRHLGEPDEPKLLGQEGVVVEADRGPDGLVDGAVAEVHL